MLYLRKPERNTAFFYYYWQPFQGEVFLNQYNPVLCSIATLRYFQPNIPIYVVDGSETASDWGEFVAQFKLNILHRPDHFFKKFATHEQEVHQQLLSKPFEVYLAAQSVSQERIVVSDSDIFWVKDPLPLENSTTEFSMDGHNSGFWYYHKKDTKFIGLWLSLMCYAMICPEIAQLILKQSSGTGSVPYLLEENVVRLLCKMTTGYNEISHKENHLSGFYDGKYFRNRRHPPKDIKNIHVMGAWGYESRLENIKRIKELSKIFDVMFTEEQKRKIFGDEDVETFSYRNIAEMKKLFVKKG